MAFFTALVLRLQKSVVSIGFSSTFLLHVHIFLPFSVYSSLFMLHVQYPTPCRGFFNLLSPSTHTLFITYLL
jgi:hypothetical protein